MNTSSISTSRILTEFAILTVSLYAAWYVFTAIVYPSWGLEGNAPVPARTIVAVILIAIFLKLSGQTFADLGFYRPKRIWLVLVSALFLVVLQIFGLQFVVFFATKGFEAFELDHELYRHLQGSELALVGWLTIVWTAAAFGEEIFFRGYLIQRITTLLGGGTAALWLAVAGQAVLFGLGHAYQGPVAIIGTGMGAFMFGAFYVLSGPLLGGRNLWPVIIAHGFIDTLGLTLIYFNGVP